MTDQKSKKPRSIFSFRQALADFHVDVDTVREGYAVCITGALGICAFNSEFIELRIKTGKIGVSGSGLSLLLYENGRAEIMGKISEVKFLRDKF